MVSLNNENNFVNIIRITFEFYPIKGGSVNHTIELSKKLNPYLKTQLIIAPKFEGEYNEFDSSFGIPIIRVSYPKLKFLTRIKLPVKPLILWVYARRVVKEIKGFLKKMGQKNTIICVHGTPLGAFILFLLKINKIKSKVILYQHSGDPISIGIRSALLYLLGYFILFLFKPTKLLILDDGTNIYRTIKICSLLDIPYDIIPHAINWDEKKYENNKKENKRENFVILSNHRLDKFKRVDLAVLAFSAFLRKLDEKEKSLIRFLIVGDGPERKKIEEIVKKERLENHVIFCGEKRHEEVIKFINESDVIVGTSLKSNLNRAILEAMTCGKPVIVFNSGRISEIINHLENGILVKAGNIDEFAVLLRELYLNPEIREKIGNKAKETVKNRFSWDNRLKKELKIIYDILSN
ncbi:MAG: glycosyltransferase family 4 protein [Candidatus Micrarchaeia archaeon]